MKPETKAVDPRELAIQAGPARAKELPAGVVRDLQYFAQRAQEGAAISFPALKHFIQMTHGVSIGRLGAANAVRAFGGVEWWK